MTNHSDYVIIDTERNREVNKNVISIKYYQCSSCGRWLYLLWILYDQNYVLLKKNKKIFKKLLTNRSDYVIINTERKKRGT